jgi:hypothetical protein
MVRVARGRGVRGRSAGGGAGQRALAPVRKPLVIPGILNGISDFSGKCLTPRRSQTATFGTLVRRVLVPKKREAR